MLGELVLALILLCELLGEQLRLHLAVLLEKRTVLLESSAVGLLLS